MLDKNGREIKTGDIVRITGAYFRHDNSLYFVYRSPGDVNWCGNFHSLHKISKRGKVSTAKYNICFWPITSTVSSYEKTVLANEWNREHAEIEITENVPLHEVKAHFENEAAEVQESIDWERSRCYGTNESQRLKSDREYKAFLDTIVARVANRI